MVVLWWKHLWRTGLRLTSSQHPTWCPGSLHTQLRLDLSPAHSQKGDRTQSSETLCPPSWLAFNWKGRSLGWILFLAPLVFSGINPVSLRESTIEFPSYSWVDNVSQYLVLDWGHTWQSGSQRAFPGAHRFLDLHCKPPVCILSSGEIMGFLCVHQTKRHPSSLTLMHKKDFLKSPEILLMQTGTQLQRVKGQKTWRVHTPIMPHNSIHPGLGSRCYYNPNAEW